MINSHQFKEAAKKFRAGRISLSQFTDLTLGEKPSVTAKPIMPPAETNDALTPAPSLIGELRQRLVSRPMDSHKGDFGRVLAIGGSEGMSGAISLTAMAAMRVGTGLIKVAVPEMIQGLVATQNPCLMTIGCAADGDCFHGANESSLSHHCEWADVVAIGPGMGRGGAQQWIVKNLYESVPQPMVVDADGLNAISDSETDLALHEGQRVLTPHPGEYFRLTGEEFTSRDDMEKHARQLAAKNNVVVVVKGRQTFVTDGQADYRNMTGNPGMATAGSGDVLTGVITSLIGQGFTPFEASVLGVYLHGTAGDNAAAKVGQTSLIATDIVSSLPAAIRGL